MLFNYKKLVWCLLFLVVVLAVFVSFAAPEGIQTNADNSQKTLVIDAGHGGEDGGAVASNGTTESGINLDIALRLEALAKFWGIPAVMTRTTEDIPYPESAETLSAKKKADQNARIELIQNLPGAVLISIHQNYYPSATPWGIQVFYGKVAGGSELGEIVQKNLTTQISPENRRVAAPIDESIYLMRKVSCPAILVECGFLSNQDELAKLETENYRLKLAAVIFASYQQYTEGMIT